jgi:hypothetical protein
LFFARRIVTQALYWPDHRDEAVKPWMTAGYVGKSWGLNPRLIGHLVGLPPP